MITKSERYREIVGVLARRFPNGTKRRNDSLLCRVRGRMKRRVWPWNAYEAIGIPLRFAGSGFQRNCLCHTGATCFRLRASNV